MISKAARKHSRKNSKISLLSSEDVIEGKLENSLPMQISNTMAGTMNNSDIYNVKNLKTTSPKVTIIDQT